MFHATLVHRGTQKLVPTATATAAAAHFHFSAKRRPRRVVGRPKRRPNSAARDFAATQVGGRGLIFRCFRFFKPLQCLCVASLVVEPCEVLRSGWVSSCVGARKLRTEFSAYLSCFDGKRKEGKVKKGLFCCVYLRGRKCRKRVGSMLCDKEGGTEQSVENLFFRWRSAG